MWAPSRLACPRRHIHHNRICRSISSCIKQRRVLGSTSSSLQLSTTIQDQTRSQGRPSLAITVRAAPPSRCMHCAEHILAQQTHVMQVPPAHALLPRVIQGQSPHQLAPHLSSHAQFVSSNIPEPAPSDTSLLTSRSAFPPPPTSDGIPGHVSGVSAPATSGSSLSASRLPVSPPPPIPIATDDQMIATDEEGFFLTDAQIALARRFLQTELARQQSKTTQWLCLVLDAKPWLEDQLPRYRRNPNWSDTTCVITYELLQKFAFCPGLSWPPMDDLTSGSKYPVHAELFDLYANVRVSFAYDMPIP
jgi:hypothetical protein